VRPERPWWNTFGSSSAPTCRSGSRNSRLGAPVDGGAAGVRLGQSKQQADGGGFPGPVRADKPGDTARDEFEGEVVDGGDGAVPLGQRLDGDGAHDSSP